MLIAALLSGCGAEGTSAPEIDVPPQPCPDLDERLTTTLAAVAEGKAENLAATLQAMNDERGEALDAALESLLGILSVLWLEIKDDPAAIDLAGLSSVLEDLGGVLANVVRYLGGDGPTQTQSFETIRQILTECPSGSLTGALQLLLARPQLLSALGDALSDPTIAGLISSFPEDGSGSSQRGFAALIRTVIRAINNPNFVFQDLVDLIDPFFDTSQPPISGLITELQFLMTGDNLVTIRVLTTCIENDIEVLDNNGDSVTGSFVIGALLYGLITEAGLTDALDQLGPALALLQQPEVQSLLNAIIDHLANDEATREGLKPLLLFLLRPEHVQGAMTDLADLIEAGLLPELITLVGDIFIGCEDGGTP